MVSPAGLFCRYGPVNSCHPPCGMGSTSARPARLVAIELVALYRARRRTRQDDPRAPAVRPLGPAPPSTRLIVGSRECASRPAAPRTSPTCPSGRLALTFIFNRREGVSGARRVTAEKLQIRSRNSSYNTPVTRHPIATRGRPQLDGPVSSRSREVGDRTSDALLRPLPGFNSSSPDLHVLMYDWGGARSSAGRRISTR